MTMRRFLGVWVGLLLLGCDDPPQTWWVADDRCPAQTRAAQSVATIPIAPALPPPQPPNSLEQCYAGLAQTGESIFFPDQAAERLAHVLWQTDAATLVQTLGEVPVDPNERLVFAIQASAAPQALAGYRAWARSWLDLKQPVDRADLDAGVLIDAGANAATDASARIETDLIAQKLEEGLLRFVESVVASDGYVSTLLTSNHLFVDATLAPFYGVDWSLIQPNEPWLDLNAPHYGGLLTQGFMLRTRTTPASRGRFVHEKVLGIGPPTFPHDATLTVPEPAAAQSQREAWQNAITAGGPQCTACHQVVDPIGFAFSHYDAQGQYQENDSGGPIDSSTQIGLSGAEQVLVQSTNDLTQLLAKDPRPTHTIAQAIFDHVEVTEALAASSDLLRTCHEALELWLTVTQTPQAPPVRDLFVQIVTRNWLGQPFGPYLPPNTVAPMPTSMPTSPTLPPPNPQPDAAPPPSGGCP